MQVVVTLASYGDSVGPFVIYYGYYPQTDTLIASNLGVEELANGYPVTVPDNIDYIKVCNLDPYAGSNCEYIYYVPPSVSPTPSLTPTVTKSPTVTPTVTKTPTPTKTPSRTVTPTITATPSITPTQTATPSLTPTQTATPSITPTKTITPTITPSITATPSITPSETATPSLTPSASITPTITPSTSITPTTSITPSITPSPSLTPSITPTLTATPSLTPTQTATPSLTPSQTATPSITPTVSITPTITATPSITPSETATPSLTPSASITPTITPSPSLTPSITATPSLTPSETPTPSITPTLTATPSITPSKTITPTITPSPSLTPSETPTPSITPTQTATPSITPSETATPSLTPTTSLTPTLTPSETVTPSLTPTQTATPSVTATTSLTPTVTKTPSLTPSITRTPTVTPSTVPVEDIFCAASFDTSPYFAEPYNNDTQLLVGGRIYSYGTYSEVGLLRMNLEGTVDPTFNTGTGFGTAGGNLIDLSQVAVQPDGKIIVVGDFISFNGATHNRIIRLESDGTTVDTSFSTGTGFNDDCFAVKLLPDGKILVGGEFSSYDGVSRNRLVRLNSDGTLDYTFITGTGFSGGSFPSVRSIDVQTDGKILIGGDFTSYDGTSLNRVCRLEENGFLDSTFNIGTGIASSTAQGAISKIKQLSDGKVMISGLISSYNGNTVYGAVRTTNSGSYDSTFDFRITDTLYGPQDFVETSFGKYIFVGSFSTYDSQTKAGIIATNTDGTIYTTFNVGVGFDGSIGSITGYGITELSNGQFVVVGGFNKYKGVTIPQGILLLNTNGNAVTCPGFFSAITSDPKATISEACAGPFLNPDPTVGNASTFCTSTLLTNPSYGAFSTGTYYIAYNGQYVQVSITNGNNTATVTSACATCPTPTPTVTPTVTRTASLTPSITPTTSLTPTRTPSITATPSLTPTLTPTRTPSITATPTLTPSITPTTSLTPTLTPSVTITPTLSAFAIQYGYYTTSYSNSTDACRLSDLPNGTLYAAPGNTTPSVGMILYTVSFPLSVPFNGQNLWWRLQRETTVWAIRIDTQGTIMAAGIVDCSTIPSETPSRTPSVTPSASLTPSLTPTRTPSITPTITITPTLTPTVTQTTTRTPSLTPSITPTRSITPTLTPSVTVTPTISAPAVGYGYYNAANYSNATDACRNAPSVNATLYAAPGNESPTIGMLLYTTAFPLSNLFNGQNLWWKIQKSATVWAMQINTVGSVTAITDCSTIPSETPSRTPSPTPSLTPTSTQTPTRTPSLTPSITPTRTITPTLTPSITITPTLSASAIGYGYYSTTNYSNATDACRLGDLPNATLYAAPGNTSPSINMVLYTTEFPLSNPFNGQNLYWRVSKGGTVWGMQINTIGQVTAFTDCSTIPSETPSRTPTPTPSTSPAAVTSYAYYINTLGEADAQTACDNFPGDLGDTVYSDIANIVTVSRFWTDSGLTTGFDGGSEYWAYSRDTDTTIVRRAIVSSTGNLSSQGNC